MSEAAVLVGLFDGYMNEKDDHATLETKIGGRPTYSCKLTPELINEITHLTQCKVCGRPMFLLLQAFSPLQSVTCDDGNESENVLSQNQQSATECVNESEYNRMLYVFCCNSASCAKEPQRSWSAFSLQVNGSDFKEQSENSAKECLEEKQEKILDISNEDNTEIKDGGNEPLLPSQLAPHSFPPCFVLVDDEPHDTAAPLTSLEQELLRKAEHNKATLSSEDQRELEELAQIVERGHDYYYDKFRHRLERAPTQVLRYYPADVRLDNSSQKLIINNITDNTTNNTNKHHKRCTLRKRDKPLFMNPPLMAQGVVIPPCSECGGPRTHELQVMPTALFYLHVEDYVEQHVSDKHTNNNIKQSNNDDFDDLDNNTSTTTNKTVESVNIGTSLDGVDFGTVTIYTCAHECAKYSTGVYLHKEFVCVEEAPPMHLPSEEQHEEHQYEEE